MIKVSEIIKIKLAFEMDKEVWGLGIGFVKGDIVFPYSISIIFLCFRFGIELEVKS